MKYLKFLLLLLLLALLKWNFFPFQDDYDLLDASILSDNKLGFIQLRDNKLKIQGE